MAALTEVARPIREDRRAAANDFVAVLATIALIGAGMVAALWLAGFDLLGR